MRELRPRVVGRYALYDPLGVGGMGTVHVGVLRSANGLTPIAAKQLHAAHARDPQSVAMLLDEVRLTRLAQHPNVVPVVDLAYDGEQMVLVMEYVHGESLRHLLAAAKKQGVGIPVRIAAAVLVDVLRALHAAHQARDESGQELHLVHRDVTPENILVEAAGVTRLADFGVAKASGRLHATRAGGVKGKFAYLAPEQVGGDVTWRADLYSAGLVLWEMLTGERAVKGDDEAQLIINALDPKIPRPSTKAAGIPPALDDVVVRALSIAPSDRYASGEEFVKAIEGALAPEGIADKSDVAAWVTQVAGDKLRERAARVSEILREERKRATKTPRALLLAGAAIVAAGAILAQSFAEAPEPNIANGAPNPPSIDPGPSPSASPGPDLGAALAPAPLFEIPADPAPAVAPVRVQPKKRAPAATSARNSNPCDPPYVVDAKGIRTYKQECFQ